MKSSRKSPLLSEPENSEQTLEAQILALRADLEAFKEQVRKVLKLD